jgi:pimeloyl-ACP methyl ester carboxylesterase
MDVRKMPEGINHNRRRFLGTAGAAALALGATQLGMIRGYGTTAFISDATPRNVDQAAFALDILALMDALGIEKAILAGYDWGSRTGDIIAALWPKRCEALGRVNPNTRVSKGGCRRLLPSPFPRSPLTVSTIPLPRPGTVRHTETISPASTSTGSSRSVTTCRRKHPAPSPRLSSTRAVSDGTGEEQVMDMKLEIIVVPVSDEQAGTELPS